MLRCRKTARTCSLTNGTTWASGRKQLLSSIGKVRLETFYPQLPLISASSHARSNASCSLGSVLKEL